MGYRSLFECVQDLRRTGQLVELSNEIDPFLEAAEIQRRVYQAGGPAILFSRVQGTSFPMVSNLFGTLERARFLFRDAIDSVQRLIELKADPDAARRHPFRSLRAAVSARYARPKWIGARRAPVLAHRTHISSLPQLVSWPNDGGAFITLPIVYSEDPSRPGWSKSNLGMYRVQLSGGLYAPDAEIGMHYQIHRGIGVHHRRALENKQRLPVHIYVGGPPAMTLAAVMPLPEALPELAFGGVLGRRRVRLVHDRNPNAADGMPTLPVWGDADFCIRGFIDPGKQLPEGPFGDHLGYYSLQHPFPVVHVESVSHRSNAIWPFTAVGRPPQEDTVFGKLIHELTGPMIPAVLPGVKAVHAVDAAGVHPLLLAIGSERYRPYDETERPQELLTQANAILGQGQMSLAKYVFIVNGADDPDLDIHDIPSFFRHLLERIEPTRDIHFQTETTIDTLDYSGQGFHVGSKVVIAAAGRRKRELPTTVGAAMSARLPEGFRNASVAMPGVLVVQAPLYVADSAHRLGQLDQLGQLGQLGQPGQLGHTEQRILSGEPEGEVHARRFVDAFRADDEISRFPLIVLVDDSEFASRTLNNFLWVTFTRSNPATDMYGIASSVTHKHWGCRGAVVIDARAKPHHAPALVEDPAVSRRVDALAARGGPLHGVLG